MELRPNNHNPIKPNMNYSTIQYAKIKGDKQLLRTLEKSQSCHLDKTNNLMAEYNQTERKLSRNNKLISVEQKKLRDNNNSFATCYKYLKTRRGKDAIKKNMVDITSLYHEKNIKIPDITPLTSMFRFNALLETKKDKIKLRISYNQPLKQKKEVNFLEKLTQMVKKKIEHEESKRWNYHTARITDNDNKNSSKKRRHEELKNNYEELCLEIKFLIDMISKDSNDDTINKCIKDYDELTGRESKIVVNEEAQENNDKVNENLPSDDKTINLISKIKQMINAKQTRSDLRGMTNYSQRHHRHRHHNVNPNASNTSLKSLSSTMKKIDSFSGTNDTTTCLTSRALKWTSYSKINMNINMNSTKAPIQCPSIDNYCTIKPFHKENYSHCKTRKDFLEYAYKKFLVNDLEDVSSILKEYLRKFRKCNEIEMEKRLNHENIKPRDALKSIKKFNKISLKNQTYRSVQKLYITPDLRPMSSAEPLLLKIKKSDENVLRLENKFIVRVACALKDYE